MNRLFLILSGCVSFSLFAQSDSDNEILRVAALRAKFDEQLEVLVYPNPSSDQTVWLKGDYGASYMLHTLSGQLVLEGIIDDQQVRLTDLFPGTYMMTVEKDGKVARSKVVVL